DTAGTNQPTLALSSDQQLDIPAAGNAGPAGIHRLSSAIRDLWTTYGVVAPEPTYTPTPSATPAPRTARTATPTPPASQDQTPPVIGAVQAVPTTVSYGPCAGQTADLQ